MTWKTIEEYPMYSIDENGNVFSRYSNKILKPILVSNGYYSVQLFNERGAKCKTIHRLVATAFIPNPENLPCVNHKDEIKTNNHVSNLEWCTHAYNSTFGTAQERRLLHTDYSKRDMKAVAPQISEKLKIPILQYTKDMKLIRRFDSAKDAKMEIGVDASHIGEVCRGKRKTAGGYVWKYERRNDLSVSEY